MSQTEDIDFKKIFECSPALCLVLDPNLIIIAVSDAYLKATMTTREQIIGKDVFEVFPNNPNAVDLDGVSYVKASFLRVIKNKISDMLPVIQYDIRRPAHEGGKYEIRYWSPVNAPVLDENGDVKYIVHRVEDVTDAISYGKDKKNMEIEIMARTRDLEKEEKRRQKSEESLLKVNKELEAFTYSVSHDLRAPLRSIDGFSRILEDKYKNNMPEEGRHFLLRIRESASDMGKLIDDLLDFSRLGKQVIKRQKIDLKKIVELIIDELIENKAKVSITIEIGDLPSCEADEALLKQAMKNLISNAIKYSQKKEKPKIEIGCQIKEKEKEIVYFIKDNGVGFDMKYAHKLFNVFQRLHSEDEYEGTGVGLAIVDRIIRRHNGRIWAEAEPQKGAIFYFTVGDNDNEEE